MENVGLQINSILQYADKCVLLNINRYARKYPPEIKEEIRQTAAMRIFLASKKIDESKSWKSFVQYHARGAVLDYLKGGNGFTEEGKVTDQNQDGIRFRVELSDNDNGEILDVSETLGLMGVFSDSSADRPSVEAKWDLLNRMATKDFHLAIVGKVLLGFSQEDIAKQYNFKTTTTNTRERISQRLYEFFERLDDPFYFYCRWENQCIFALGLTEKYGTQNDDNGVGWDLPEVDLRDPMFFFRARKLMEVK